MQGKNRTFTCWDFEKIIDAQILKRNTLWGFPDSSTASTENCGQNTEDYQINK
jgi:hypothetical protein